MPCESVAGHWWPITLTYEVFQKISNRWGIDHLGSGLWGNKEIWNIMTKHRAEAEEVTEGKLPYT